MASISDKLKQRIAEKRMQKQIAPIWPEGYPKQIAPKPAPCEGYIENRIVYRRVTNTKEKEKVAEFYVSNKAAYFHLELDDKVCSWYILSFEEYVKEYSILLENLKTKGLNRTAFKTSEIELFDDVLKIVPLKLIMELDPTPEELDILEAGNMTKMESEIERKMEQDQNFLDSIG